MRAVINVPGPAFGFSVFSSVYYVRARPLIRKAAIGITDKALLQKANQNKNLFGSLITKGVFVNCLINLVSLSCVCAFVICIPL